MCAQQRLEDGIGFHGAGGCGKIVCNTASLQGANARGGPNRAVNAPETRRVEAQAVQLGGCGGVGCTSWCKEDYGIALATVGECGVESPAIEDEGGMPDVDYAPRAG